MAKQKATSGVAAKTAVQKKWTGLRTAAKPAARKTIKSKAHVSASKHKVRPQQRIAISHHREEDFKADGLRTYAQYRHLGIADTSHGLAQAQVIRLFSP